MIEFGYNSTHIKPTHTNYIEQEFKGYILKLNTEHQPIINKKGAITPFLFHT